MDLASFYKGKKVLVTGHTGFKGSWMCRMLALMGAKVTGYALSPEGEENLFTLSGVEKEITSVEGDIRDRDHLLKTFQEARPEIVIHMAAQPLVRRSYEEPAYTYETNVMGTVNVMEALRQTGSVRSFVNVTTDKVYRNREWLWGYRENEELDGYDPYSNSKSCSELVTATYRRSFFGGDAGGKSGGRALAISTMRAGNVIGGGDFAKDRIIPDCIRFASKGEEIIVRNPHSTRPYQFVLEPVTAYLLLAALQEEDPSLAGAYNIGPEDVDCLTTGNLVDLFCKVWNQTSPNGGKKASWKNVSDGGPHEAGFLKLDSSKAHSLLDWHPRYHIESAVKQIIEWTRCYLEQGDIPALMDEQIRDFLQA